MVTANGGVNQQRVAVSCDCVTHYLVRLFSLSTNHLDFAGKLQTGL